MPDAASSISGAFDLPFDEAIAFFKAKGMDLSPDGWRQVWRDANSRAFTVARITQMDVLSDIKSAVAKAHTDGTTLQQFKKDLIPLLEKKGWFAPKGQQARVEMPDGTMRKRITPWRLETIYRTNMATAYQAGRYRQMMEVSESRPYWQYMAIMDKRTRPAHAAMNGKIYDCRHPIWEQWYPPNGFNCRCYVKALSERQVRDRGLEVRTRGVDVHPDEGWDYHVGKEGLGGRWDQFGNLPDCLSVDFVERGNCIKTSMGQKTWKEYGRPDLRHVPDGERHPEPVLIEPGKSKDEALGRLLEALEIDAEHPERFVWTPVGPVILLSGQMVHLVEKRIDARERYANFIIPTLEAPYEVYLTEYEDGLRSRYIGLFKGKHNLTVVVRVNRDGSLLWNVMQGRDKDMNKHRIGELIWPK